MPDVVDRNAFLSELDVELNRTRRVIDVVSVTGASPELTTSSLTALVRLLELKAQVMGFIQ